MYYKALPGFISKFLHSIINILCYTNSININELLLTLTITFVNLWKILSCSESALYNNYLHKNVTVLLNNSTYNNVVKIN